METTNTAYTVAKTVFITVSSLGFVFLIFRFSRRKSVKEYFWFVSAFLFFVLRIVFSETGNVRTVFSLLFLWTGGCYLSYISGIGRTAIWTAVVAVAAGIIFSIRLLGYYGTLPFSIFYLFIVGLASLYPIGLLFRYYLQTRDRLFLYFFIAFLIWLAGSFYQTFISLFTTAGFDIVLWAAFAPLAGLFYFIFEQGYLKGTGLRSYNSKLNEKEKQITSTLAQLIQTENTAIVNDRLIAAGLLAAGSAHEFKNMLSSINTAAEYGIYTDNPDEKDKSLNAILSNIRIGKEIVTDLLEKLAVGGREKEEIIDIKSDIKYLLKIIKVTYRMKGIKFKAELDDDIRVYGRRGEVEQIILNIIRNAFSAFEDHSERSDKVITISAKKEGGNVIIDISDNAGGVPNEIIPELFEPSFSGSHSTGLGLYLTKALVQRNGGEVEYIPIKGGSTFRLIFLSEEGENPAAPWEPSK
ncbi:MAG: hypothetical protein DRP57_07950 [Spirochaetes bacterium]|nr:MAG: hypothetical protein DRP57_07950 [Spirochaetota bacterium]